MCAWKLRCTQSFLGFISGPAPRNAQYKSRLIPCSSSCCNPITIIPSPVDSLTRIEKIKFNNLLLKGGWRLIKEQEINLVVQSTDNNCSADNFKQRTRDFVQNHWKKQWKKCSLHKRNKQSISFNFRRKNKPRGHIKHGHILIECENYQIDFSTLI